MNANLSLTRTAALLASLACALVGTARAAEADALPAFDENYIKVSGLLPGVTGSNAAFQRRMQVLHEGAAGIEELRYAYDLSKETNLQFDGKFMPGAEDYLAQVKITKAEIGSFEAGYKTFRTYYDGAGGFFPTNNAWIPLYPRSRWVDRANLYVNGTIAVPNMPVFEFRYSNQLRSGIKDSTIWGDSDFTGIPIYSQSSLNPITSTRKILPAYIDISERLQTWEATVRHSVGQTSYSLSLIGTQINNFDSRTVDRYTGELKPYPAIPSTPAKLVAPNLANNPNKGTDDQRFAEDAFTVLGKVESKVSDQIAIFFEGSARHSTGDTASSRLISVQLATGGGVQNLIGAYATGQRPAYSYTSAGNFATDTYTGVLGLRYQITPTLNVETGIRGEVLHVRNDATVNYVANRVTLANGTYTNLQVPGTNSLRIDETPWTPEVSIRYSGLRDLSLYGNWDYRSVNEDEVTNYTAFTVNTSTGALTGPLVSAADRIKERHSNLKVGASWTVNPNFSARGEIFTKDHENRFSSVDDYYILDYDIKGFRVSGVLKALPSLTFNSRYVFQEGKAKVDADGYGVGESNDSVRHQLSETVDWAPNKSFYVQANINRVWDTIRTSYPVVTGAAQTVVHNADNNYWNGSVVAVFIVDKDTDANIQATYYDADNYNRALAGTTEPFGMSARETTFSVGFKHKLTAKAVVSAKLGYFDSQSATTGGNTNFRGPLGYLALEYGL